MNVREKYPTSRYDPDPNCKFCKGSGERDLSDKDLGVSPCICIFVDHSFAEEAATTLGKCARNLRKQLEGFEI